MWSMNKDSSFKSGKDRIMKTKSSNNTLFSETIVSKDYYRCSSFVFQSVAFESLSILMNFNFFILRNCSFHILTASEKVNQQTNAMTLKEENEGEN